MVKKIDPVKIAVIGGSGISEISGIENVKDFEIDTPFGKPSAPITIGTVDDVRVAFYQDTEKVILFYHRK